MFVSPIKELEKKSPTFSPTSSGFEREKALSDLLSTPPLRKRKASAKPLLVGRHFKKQDGKEHLD
jgi:hypothetical protein